MSPSGKRVRPPLAVAPFDAATAKELQQLWAGYLSRRVEEEAELGGGILMKFILIPSGTFHMGSPASDKDAEEDEKPQHVVEITKEFYLAKYPVTVGQFRQFVHAGSYQTVAEKYGKGGYGFTAKTRKFEQKPEYTWKNPGFDQTDEHPVVNVSWQDAQAFCAWLDARGEHKYGLPSEAQWEYACRAGTTTRFSSGQEDESLKGFANIADASLKRVHPAAGWAVGWEDGYPFTAPVGKFQPNAWGLYDTHGNVWEWCQDYYDADYFKISPRENPLGPGGSAGASRVIRGGAWFIHPGECRAACRGRSAPSRGYGDRGFRVLRLR